MCKLLDGVATGVVVTGLEAGTTYYFRVATVDGVMTSTYASEVPATMLSTILATPSVVHGLVAVPGDEEVTPSWEVPYDGGSAITHYKVRQANSEADLSSATPYSIK